MPAPKPPFDAVVEELLGAVFRVGAKAAKRGAAAVVSSALEDADKLRARADGIMKHARARIEKIMENPEEKNDGRH
jgi:hypothetical protein